MHLVQHQKTRIRYAAVAALVVVALGLSLSEAASPADPQVLFVCEHGNVKSLMAASYFNELARARGVPFRAISRGSAPDSTSVPPAIISGLKQEGFDVAAFRPAKVAAPEVQDALRVILIGTSLPESTKTPRSAVETWNDIPPASEDYAAASRALKMRIDRLMDELLAAARN